MDKIPRTHMDKLPRTPMVLLPYQQKWCADLSEVKIWEKSRRIGASWAEAADSALLSASQNGMNTFYIGYSKDMAQEFIHDAANWAKFYNLAAGEITEEEEVFEEGNEKKSILTYVIRFASGFKIVALSSRPRNLRAKQGRIIIDEAAFHEDLDSLRKAAIALLIWGGQLHIISTHDGVDNSFNQLIQEVLAGKFDYSIHHTSFDQAIAEGLYERVCLRTKRKWTLKSQKEWVQSIRALYGDDAEEELDVIPANGSGAWLSRALIEARMSINTPVIRFEQKAEFNELSDSVRAAVTQEFIDDSLMPLLRPIPKHAITFLGEDFARTGDLSVYVPLVQQTNLRRVPPFFLELFNIPHTNQEQIMVALCKGLPNLRGGAFDGRGNGHYIAERAHQLFSCIEVVMLTEGWYKLNMPPLKAALEDGDLDELPKNEGVLSDMRAAKVIRGVARLPDKKNKGEEGEKRHGDSLIALALAFYASRELNKLPVKAKAGKPRASKRLLQGY